MELNKTILAVGGSLAMGLASSANAGTELDALKARIAQLEAKQASQATSEARAAEFSALVNEVLADVDSRSSALAAGTAGHNGKFFLASEDGTSKLTIGGQVQARYIWNNRDNAVGSTANNDNDDVSGFQMRRTKLKFKGNANGVGYKATLAANRSSGNISLEDVALTLKLSDNLKVKIGRDKLPFNLEELTSSSKQVAVDRTLVNEVFGVGRGEGITLMYAKDNLRTALSFSDGARSGEAAARDFDDNASDYALTARAEYLVSGTWGQSKDQSAWSGEGQNLVVGAGVHYQDNQGAQSGTSLSYTVDVAYENNGLSVTGALYGQTVETHDVGGNEFDHYGATAQVAYFFEADKKQVFARVETLDIETAGSNVIWTAGINCYTKGHAAKFTADVVFSTQAVVDYTGTSGIVGTGSTEGLGLLDDNSTEDGQAAVRLQYQLLF